MSKIFVFGSNEAGVHGAGAAKYACKYLGAEWGFGEGLTGQTYALPTKDYNINSRSLGEIEASVDLFVEFARSKPDLTFQVTRIGCGLAGFEDREIAPLFSNAPSNCEFDSFWKLWLPDHKFWGTF